MYAVRTVSETSVGQGVLLPELSTLEMKNSNDSPVLCVAVRAPRRWGGDADPGRRRRRHLVPLIRATPDVTAAPAVSS
jgi:hypothetical protein